MRSEIYNLLINIAKPTIVLTELLYRKLRSRHFNITSEYLLCGLGLHILLQPFDVSDDSSRNFEGFYIDKIVG